MDSHQRTIQLGTSQLHGSSGLILHVRSHSRSIQLHVQSSEDCTLSQLAVTIIHFHDMLNFVCSPSI